MYIWRAHLGDEISRELLSLNETGTVLVDARFPPFINVNELSALRL